MKTHYSKFGLLAMCGRRIVSKRLYRDWSKVTCKTCLRAIQ